MHAHLETLHQLYTSETQSFRKVHRMIDLFESIIKSHTVVVLGEYVKHNKLSDAAKGMLAQGLRTPSLGTWQLFSRVMFEELQADGYTWTFTDFLAEFATLDKALNADKTNVIAFRNGYAHGATPTDEQCEADIAKFDPFLKKLLECRWLNTTHLETRDGKVWVIGESAEVCVHPVLVNKADGVDMPYAFFNDLKNDRVGLLNYPLSKHYREKEFFKEFHEFLPLHEWKKTGNNEFYQRIEELTETFKGRTLERERLLQFVRENHKGYCSIQGNPGIGKSALIAQFFKDLRAQKELTDVQVVEYFIRRGTIQAQTEYVFNYLIRRTDELFAPGKEIRAEGKAVWDLQQQLFAKWRLWGEQSAGKKLLFLIDGLDEGTENNVVTYMPRENFEGVLIIFGSRPGGHKTIEDLWTQLPTEHHTKLELVGLGREDIRALIYEVANKYEVERESAWIDAVQQRSQGNPLYLKLLCDALEHGSIALNDIQALPDKIDEYYKAILDRYAADTVDGDALLAGLFTFAAARDYLTMAHLGLINKLGDATVQRIGSTLKEVLYENPLTEEVLDYQLFHESFREYLVKEKALKVRDAMERIIDFCATWRELEGTWEQRYALQHYAAHAAVSAREARATELLTLPGNTAYIETQKKVLKQFDSTKELYRLCLLKANEMKQYDRQLEAALCLVDLKYEEANDAPQVVALVAAGDIDLALKRIESFGGVDEEGVKRRFTLYMLCLMELTLLESKAKPFRKTAIEKLLNHLDEHIPPDTSIINWNDFFPSYLMFLMACDWAELGMDYLIVYKRTYNWEKDWIKEKGPYTYLQFQVLLDCARSISFDGGKNSGLMEICSELAKQRKNEDALECAHGISEVLDKILSLQCIANELVKHGDIEEAAHVMRGAFTCAQDINDSWKKSNALKSISIGLAEQGKIEEALECARVIISEYWKCIALQSISSVLAINGKREEAAKAISEAIKCARDISSDPWKSYALKEICSELAKQGRNEEALECTRGISKVTEKSEALQFISCEMSKKGKTDEALQCARDITDESKRNSALESIYVELAKQGDIDKAFQCANDISSDRVKCNVMLSISGELAKAGQIEEAASAMQKAFNYAKTLTSEHYWNEAFWRISIELAKQNRIADALACSRTIYTKGGRFSRDHVIRDISASHVKLEELPLAVSIILANLELSRGMNNIDNGRSLASISAELAKRNMIVQSIKCANQITREYYKFHALKDISIRLMKFGRMEEAIKCFRDIDVKHKRTFSLALKAISLEFVKQDRIEDALQFCNEINDAHWKVICLREISMELFNRGSIEESQTILNEALELARKGCHDFESFALADISSELFRQGQSVKSSLVKEEALRYARSRGGEDQASLLAFLSTELFKQEQHAEASIVIHEAIECSHSLTDHAKCEALSRASKELYKQGNWPFTETIGWEIPLLLERQDCWKGIAGISYKQCGCQKSFHQVRQFQSDEARLFYLKGWAEAVNEHDADNTCIQEALSQLALDSESIETILRKHALHEVFFGNAGPDKINRLNRTLNIQWALDIAAQFHNEESNARLSTNLDTWLHEIADEDDRDQITLWAKQVAKGKITEEEFGERVRGME